MSRTPWGPSFTRAEHIMSDHDIMRFLYGLGYWRAVVLSSEDLPCGLRYVTFENVSVKLPACDLKHKPTPLWPSPSLFNWLPGAPLCRRLLQMMIAWYGMEFHFRTLKPFSTLLMVFCSGDPAGHDFPSTTQTALRMSISVNLEDFDRIIIYVRWSSHLLTSTNLPCGMLRKADQILGLLLS